MVDSPHIPANAEVQIPTLWSRASKAYPGHAKGARANYLPLRLVLSARFKSDAHFAAYSCPAIARRLDSDAPVVIHGGVPMHLFVADVDDPAAHREKKPASESWRTWEEGKIRALLAVHPGLFVYMTQGGYRIVGLLDSPIVIQSSADATAWTAIYRRWVAYLKRVFRIEADAACADWTRLYRVPLGTRDGVQQTPLRSGDANAVGLWRPDLKPEDVGAPVRRARKVVPLRGEGADVTDTMPDESTLPPIMQRAEWACAWVQRQPRSIQGEGGSTPCFNVLLGLIRGWCLPVDWALEIFAKLYNVEPKCSPPWDQRMIDHKVNQVLNRAEKPWGYILSDHLEAERFEREARAALLESMR